MLRWITQHAEYDSFFQSHIYVRTAHFFAPVIRSEEGFSLGITISKKIGNAVCRNKLRRRIKSWFRERESFPSAKINLVAKSGAGMLSWIDICSELEQIIAGLSH